jgi:hypothetical protein
MHRTSIRFMEGAVMFVARAVVFTGKALQIAAAATALE